MDYKEIRKEVENMINNNYIDFIKAVVGVELGINDKRGLDYLYEICEENENASLISELFVDVAN